MDSSRAVHSGRRTGGTGILLLYRMRKRKLSHHFKPVWLHAVYGRDWLFGIRHLQQRLRQLQNVIPYHARIADSPVEYRGTPFAPKDMLMIALIGYAQNTDFRISDEVNSVEWISTEDAIHMVHPKAPGNASYYLVKTYLQEQQPF